MELPTLDSPLVEAFMTKVSSELNQTFPPASEVFSFGSKLPDFIPKMNSWVLSGVKRGMAGFPAPLNPTSGDFAIAVDTNYEPAILVQVQSRTSVLFNSVTSKFVFEEGHPEITIEEWRAWHQKFWEKDLDHDGQEFGDGTGKKVLNMIFKVVYPIPKPLTADSDPIRALLELVERCTGLKVTCDQVKRVLEFGDSLSHGTNELNSRIVGGHKTAMMTFPVPKQSYWGAGDYSVGLGQFGEPYFLIQTLFVEQREFETVGEEFALSEGRGDYQEWRVGYRDNWKKKKDHDETLFGDGTGKTVLCERFITLWPKVNEEFP